METACKQARLSCAVTIEICTQHLLLSCQATEGMRTWQDSSKQRWALSLRSAEYADECLKLRSTLSLIDQTIFTRIGFSVCGGSASRVDIFVFDLIQRDGRLLYAKLSSTCTHSKAKFFRRQASRTPCFARQKKITFESGRSAEGPFFETAIRLHVIAHMRDFASCHQHITSHPCRAFRNC